VSQERSGWASSGKPRLLVIEDDRTLARGLEMNLGFEGFDVRVATDGQQGLRLALDHAPDLIVLDLMLPELDGFSVVSELRRRARATPVLILSARGEVTTKVEALGLGADDFLAKPFSLRELVARLRAHLRRPEWSAGHERTVAFGDVEVVLNRRLVYRAGQPVDVTSREFDLLAVLVRHPGRVLSRERLLAAAWSFDYEGTPRTVDNFVRQLRVKLEPDPRQPRHLLTVRGAGYRFDP
jgi:two-component system, OmpR family, alkaline phosphatase synthesis response regulator PhoP